MCYCPESSQIMSFFQFFENVCDKLMLMKIHLRLFWKWNGKWNEHNNNTQVGKFKSRYDQISGYARWSSSDLNTLTKRKNVWFWAQNSDFNLQILTFFFRTRRKILFVKNWGKKYRKKVQNSEKKKTHFRNSNKFEDKNTRLKSAWWN